MTLDEKAEIAEEFHKLLGKLFNRIDDLERILDGYYEQDVEKALENGDLGLPTNGEKE